MGACDQLVSKAYGARPAANYRCGWSAACSAAPPLHGSHGWRQRSVLPRVSVDRHTWAHLPPPFSLLCNIIST